MIDGNQPRSDRREDTDESKARPARSIDSAELFAGAREIVIRHGESEYRLRSTSRGKLLLTK